MVSSISSSILYKILHYCAAYSKYTFVCDTLVHNVVIYPYQGQTILELTGRVF